MGVVGMIVLVGTAWVDDGELSTVEVLRTRAEAPAEPPAADRPGHLDAVGGTLLFSMTAAEHADCVRSIPDITGDGLDEIVVGIRQSGVDNILCLDGASSGTATVVWGFEPYGGPSGGYVYGDQAIVLGSDTDGNGYRNLLVGTAGGGRTAYSLDTFDRSVHWQFDTYVANSPSDGGWVFSVAEMSDVTGDGVPEVALGVGFDPDSAFLVNGASIGANQAAQVWRHSAGDAVSSVRNLGDVNGDGDDDVLVSVWDSGYEFRCLDGGTTSPAGSVLWTYPTGGGSATAVGVLPDITADGVNEALAVIWTLDGSAVRALDGATGAEIWRSTSIPRYGTMVDVIDDVDASGYPDVVVGSWENAVSVLEGSDGKQIWKTTVGSTNGGDVWTARGIPDLDGDGINDVIAGSFDLHAYAMSGVDGEVLWSYDTGNRVYSVAPVGDLDSDGAPEVVVGTQHTSSDVVVLVLSGGTGAIFADDFESGHTGAWSWVVP
jgi:outer membrane protein assembly factor BamB